MDRCSASCSVSVGAAESIADSSFWPPSHFGVPAHCRLSSTHHRCGISPKKLLIPMSFATVLGGTTTLIGTSTNLVVSGLQEAKYGTKVSPVIHELINSFIHSLLHL